VLVRSTPPGARVFLDGREYGRTPVTIGSLARGGHIVRVMGEGFVADERQVTITPAQRTHSITVRLSPERSPAAASAVQPALPAAGGQRGAGQLTVESRPAGAQVFIDGQLVGITPLSLAEVPAGDHALHLDYDGYRRWSAAIKIVASQPHRVAASLDR
jgi:serine/threonine-protein kinase